MLEYVDMVTAQQLKDCIVHVSQRRHKEAIGEMFSTELKFAVDCLMRWFVKKIKSVFFESDLQTKILHESKNPLD